MRWGGAGEGAGRAIGEGLYNSLEEDFIPNKRGGGGGVVGRWRYASLKGNLIPNKRAPTNIMNTLKHKKGIHLRPGMPAA